MSEADGYELLLSAKNVTGYKYVTFHPEYRLRTYEARVWGNALGYFATAVEAAVAVAKQRKTAVAVAKQCKTSVAVAKQCKTAVAVAKQRKTSVTNAKQRSGKQPQKPSKVVSTAEGFSLPLSQRGGACGYKYVSATKRGRYKADYKVHGKRYYIGIFDTAVEAAVAVAKYVAGEPEPDAGEPEPASQVTDVRES